MIAPILYPQMPKKRPTKPKARHNITMSDEIWEFGASEAERQGLSLSAYIEQWLRSERKKSSGGPGKGK